MSKLVEPRLPGGFRDLDPQLAAARRRLIEIVEAEYKLMGSQPLDTPAVEFEQVLIGAEDYSKQLYHVVRRASEEGEAEEKNTLALRFDLTVPLARYVASHQDLAMPFIRHQVGQVWRGERQQQGRYHEFTQFDLDIVGTSSLAADAQVLATMYRVMTQLVGDRFEIRYSDRQLLDGVFDHVGIGDAKREMVMRSLDKLDKEGSEKVISYLESEVFENERPKARELLRIISMTNLDDVEDEISVTKTAETSFVISSLRRFAANLRDLGIKADNCKFDFSIIRGLGYYTGPVWETVLLDAPEFGSVYSGGRYDNLLERFGSRKLPAVGTSIGVDRMLAALEKLGKLPELAGGGLQVLVANFGEDVMAGQLQLVAELRAAGISAELYLGKEKGLGQQLGYAEGRGARVAVLFGADEQKSGEVKVKNLATKEQVSVARDGLVASVKQATA